MKTIELGKRLTYKRDYKVTSIKIAKRNEEYYAFFSVDDECGYSYPKSYGLAKAIKEYEKDTTWQGWQEIRYITFDCYTEIIEDFKEMQNI